MSSTQFSRNDNSRDRRYRDKSRLRKKDSCNFKFLREFDLYGKLLEFTFEGEERHTTQIGGFATLLVALHIIPIIGLCAANIITDPRPQIIDTVQLQNTKQFTN